jgi:hypothetical protein
MAPSTIAAGFTYGKRESMIFETFGWNTVSFHWRGVYQESYLADGIPKANLWHNPAIHGWRRLVEDDKVWREPALNVLNGSAACCCQLQVAIVLLVFPFLLFAFLLVVLLACFKRTDKGPLSFLWPAHEWSLSHAWASEWMRNARIPVAYSLVVPVDNGCLTEVDRWCWAVVFCLQTLKTPYDEGKISDQRSMCSSCAGVIFWFFNTTVWSIQLVWMIRSTRYRIPKNPTTMHPPSTATCPSENASVSLNK